MSASREKKQRQDLSGVLSEKDRKAASEAKAAHTKHVAYGVLGVVVVILAAALLIWDSGIIQRGQAAKTVALTVGDKSYTAADLDYYYYQSYQQMAQYGIVSSSTDLKNTTSAFGEGTWHEYFLESAKESLTQVSILCSEAEKAGFTLSEDGKQTVQANIDSMKEYASQNGYSYEKFLQLNYGENMTAEAFERVLTDLVTANEFSTAKAEEFTFTDDDMKAYYEENKDSLDLITYTVYTVDGAAKSTTDEDGNEVDPTEEESAAAMETAKTNADAIAAALASANTISEDDLTTYNATATAEEAEASGSSLSSNYSEWLLSADRQDGDVTVIEGTECYYAVKFLGRESYIDANDYDPVNVRYMLVRAEMDEDAEEPTEEQMNAAKATAEDLLAQFQAGEQTEEAFEALAGANSDKISESNLLENVAKGTTTEDFDAWIYDSARQSGDSAVVAENTYHGYHVVYFVGTADTTVWQQKLTSTLQSNAFSDWQSEVTETYTVTDGDTSYVG